MKNSVKLDIQRIFGIAVLAAAMVFVMAVCEQPTNDTPVIDVYTVTFNVSGELPAPTAERVMAGGKVTELALTKDGSTLDGWYKEAEFAAKWDFAVDTVSADITLYAK